VKDICSIICISSAIACLIVSCDVQNTLDEAKNFNRQMREIIPQLRFSKKCLAVMETAKRDKYDIIMQNTWGVNNEIDCRIIKP